MKEIALGEEFARKYEGEIAGEKEQLARVWPMPGAIVLDLKRPDDELTIDQARRLALLLLDAVDNAEHLHFPDDVDSETLLDDRDE